MALTMPPLQSPGSGASNQKAPFRYNTRNRVASFGSIPIANGTTATPLILPQVGMLSRIYLFINATVSDAAAAPSVAAQPFGPYNMLKRVQVVTNLGTATLWDTSGWGAQVMQTLSSKDVIWPATLVGTTADPFYQYPTSGLVQNVAKPLQFVLVLDVAANKGKNFALGLINLQAPEIRVSLNLTFGNTADIYNTTDVVTFGGNVFCWYEYFEVPPPSKNVAMPPLLVHRVLEDRTAFANTGDVLYTLPRQGKLLRLVHTMSANNAIIANGKGSTAAGIDNKRIVFNKTDTIYSQDYIVERMMNRRLYGHAEISLGSLAWDFWQAEGFPGLGDFRDVIDTEAISTVESFVTVNSGVTLGSGTNYMDSIREIVQGFSVQAAGGQ